MACKTSYEMHHNFAKIADEAGFTFNTHRPRIRVDWNKIRLIDLESLIRERKFVLIEQHVTDILDCVLESEFDVRILDEGVLKMFRLAQLAVEYQQFCRHYLDRSVHVLREEITTLAQDLDVTKKELREREEEIRKLKRKSKQSYRHTPLPYGNDNIANMILKTLSHKNEIFTSSSGDALQYNKCSYCDKVFMNQLYLKSHMSRRHPNVSEIPQRDSEESLQNKQQHTENTKLRDEILELKLKLKEMETIIKTTTEQVNINALNQPTATSSENNNITQIKPAAVVTSVEKRDAEVITNNEDYVLDRIEEWKKEEQEKYHKEINLLRTQIMESIQIFKEREATPTTPNPELKIIDQLNTTISKQGAEILTLKQELMDSRLKMEKEDAERRKESEAQMLLWSNRAEIQAKQYESLLQKLNEVAKEAQLSRAQTEAERKRVAQLENMLQQNLNNNKTASESIQDTPATQTKPISDKKIFENDPQKTPAKKKIVPKAVPAADRQTLEKLHEKAQALLNMGSLSSSSTDTSSEEKVKSPKQRLTMKDKKNTKIQNHKPFATKKIERESNHLTQSNKSMGTSKTNGPLINHKKERKIKTKTSQPKQYSASDIIKVEQNGPVPNPGSPKKILRAKITEEVNNRLITAGVDPLKNALPKFDFQKQKSQLQKQLELKAKKNPSHEKVRHSILAFLDSNVPRNVTVPPQEFVSPNKITKAFSLTSVISNVKNKALSFVKSNEMSTKDKNKSLNMEVAKRTLAMLKTPTDSTQSSPASKNSSTEPQIELNSDHKHVLSSTKKQGPIENSNKTNNRKTKSTKRSSVVSSDSEDDSDESDHKYYNSVVQQSSKSIENLIKSPARRPLSANSDYNNTVQKYTVSDDNLFRSQSVTNITIPKDDPILVNDHKIGDNSDKDSSENIPDEEPQTKEISNIKQTKGVLKNASSTSSLNKKKVLFDMDAIQMKSLSASPSQSLTEKSDGNEKYELGLINLDGEEWDISSIENEPLKNDTKLQINTRTSPKIAQLKQTIESQLARRNDTPSTAIVGGIDILAPMPMMRASSVAGSNTSLGSSILDESDNLPPVVNNKAFVKPKTVTHKDDSELDISEFSTDGLISNKNERDAF